MRVWLVSDIYALYFPQNSEDDTYVLSQFRNIVYHTVLLTVHVQFFVSIFFVSIYIQSFCLYISHSWIMHLVEDILYISNHRVLSPCCLLCLP